MGTRQHSEQREQRERSERGTSLVEFTFVALLLFMLLFGIIGFGVVLSFKQTVTQSANEAARRAAVTQGTDAQRLAAANLAVNDFESWGRDCTTPGNGMNCSGIKIHDCGADVDTNVAATKPDCITVSLVYDYAGHPILPNVPLMSAFMPDTVESSATAQITFSGP